MSFILKLFSVNAGKEHTLRFKRENVHVLDLQISPVYKDIGNCMYGDVSASSDGGCLFRRNVPLRSTDMILGLMYLKLSVDNGTYRFSG